MQIFEFVMVENRSADGFWPPRGHAVCSQNSSGRNPVICPNFGQGAFSNSKIMRNFLILMRKMESPVSMAGAFKLIPYAPSMLYRHPCYRVGCNILDLNGQRIRGPNF